MQKLVFAAAFTAGHVVMNHVHRPNSLPLASRSPFSPPHFHAHAYTEYRWLETECLRAGIGLYLEARHVQASTHTLAWYSHEAGREEEKWLTFEHRHNLSAPRGSERSLVTTPSTI